MSQSRISHYDFEFDYGLFARDVVPLLDAMKIELGGASDDEIAKELLGRKSSGMFVLLRRVAREGKLPSRHDGKDAFSLSMLLDVANLFDLDIRLYFLLDLKSKRDHRF